MMERLIKNPLFNVIMAMIFIQSIIFLFGRLFSDVVYVLIDPRIDFK